MKRFLLWRLMCTRHVKRIFAVCTAVLVIYFIFCLPDRLFDQPTATVLFDKDGQLLSAQIAGDGQWRFPPCDSVPEKFATALIEFEDRHFHDHNGVHLPSMVRAAKQNVSNGRVVSGGSTLSMQVIRMSSGNPERTIKEKLKEMIKAWRLETRYSKDEILNMYASNAPMGGNVVGLDAAAWRYYGRSSFDLSWGEAATLAVLPNAPSLMYPGKNQQKLLEKRNRLLERLWKKGQLDSLTCAISKLEPLPQKPSPLPQNSQHLLHHLAKSSKGKGTHTTIDASLQAQVKEVLEAHHAHLSANNIHNLAALVIDVKSGNVVAYLGNVGSKQEHGVHVDIIQSPRSTGSILKPLLYAAMLDEGSLLPHTLVSDIPTYLGGYAPKNFDETFSGAIPASEALSKSLNVPAILMLREYGVEKFHHLLRKLGFSHINQSPDHYGLTLILGGAEASLWDITNAYAGMSRTLQNFEKHNSRYESSDFQQARFSANQATDLHHLNDNAILNAGAIYQTYESLLKVNRPENEAGWELFSSSQKVAWKTGTSFGYRDAWAVGTTPDYVVGVWAGNADGEGRPGLTGVQAAAPVMFDIFDLLPHGPWFNPPYDDLVQVSICSKSGHRASQICDLKHKEWIPLGGTRSNPCPYHQHVHMHPETGKRVTSLCLDPSEMNHVSWFALPAVEEWYYRKSHPGYAPLPDWSTGCEPDEETSPIALVYPSHGQQIFIPRDFSAREGRVVFRATSREADNSIHWHLDGQFLGTTITIHQMEVNSPAGKKELVLMDDRGNKISRAVQFIHRD